MDWIGLPLAENATVQDLECGPIPLDRIARQTKPKLVDHAANVNQATERVTK